MGTVSHARTGVFACNGEYWTLGYGGKSVQLRDIKGLSYIHRLLQYPGKEFHALDLLSGPGAIAPSEDARIDRQESSLPVGVTLRPGLTGDAGEMLDAQAKQEYKRRLFKLREELEDLRERGEQERADKAEVEINFLTQEIRRAVGLDGRDRRAGSAAERARLNVTRAIKGALQKILERNRSLGELLSTSIRTGAFCSCHMSSGDPITWQFSIDITEPSHTSQATAPFLLRRDASFLRLLEGQTAFVGRETERKTLHRVLDQALKGTGKTVAISGALGVGKTRLAFEFSAEAARNGFLTLAGNCYDRDESVPFIPFVEILEAALAQAPSPQAFRDALGSDAAEVSRLMPQLRRMFPDVPPSLEVSPEQSRRILFNAVAELLARAAATNPMLLLIEDLHWADEGSLALLNHLTRSISNIPVVIAVTFRDNQSDLGMPLARTLDELSRPHLLEQIRLHGLSAVDVAEMLRGLSGRKPPDTVVNVVTSYTDGNPLFIEELYKHLEEQGKLFDPDGGFISEIVFDEIHVPETLRLIVGGRLARLSNATQKVLAVAAVIGHSFGFELLEAATMMDADGLLDCVEEAERAGVTLSTLERLEARFQFCHELIRQAVVEGLSAPRRQRLHVNVADAIERIYASALDDHSSDLAHHLWQAGAVADPGRTVRYLAMAARRALEQSAYDMALHDLRHALQIIAKIAPSAERDQIELQLQFDLGIALLATKGWYVADLGNAYKRAHELCRESSDDPRLFHVAFGLWSFHLVRGEHPMGRQYADEMVRFATQTHDAGLMVQAKWGIGCTQFFMGEFGAARSSLEEAVLRYEPQGHRGLAFQFGQDPCVSALCFGAMTLWMLGYLDQAETRARDALKLAREIGYPFTLTWCLTMLAKYYTMRRDYTSAATVIAEGLRLAKVHGFAFFEAGIYAYHIIGTAALGDVDVLLGGGGDLDGVTNAGYELAQTWARSALAEAFGNAGSLEIALTMLSGCTEIADRNQERYVESEIHRIAGQLRLTQVRARQSSAAEIASARSSAEQSFLTALEISGRAGAKILQLRAAISLCRLLNQTGRKHHARMLLQREYDSFTEGFGSADLKEASALLRDLGEAS